MKVLNKIMASVVALLFVATQCLAVTSVQDDGTYEGDYTTINFSTGIAGAQSTTDPSVYTVSGGPVGTDGNWTGDGTTTTLDAAPTKFIATHSTGQLRLDILDVDDITGETNSQTIDLDTNNAFIFGDNSDTLTLTATGDDFSIDTSDGGVRFIQTDSTDGTVDICAQNDSDDCMVFSTVTHVPTITTDGGSNLAITSAGGTVAMTGIVTISGAQTLTGATTATSLIIGDDTTDVIVDDQLRFASNDEESTIEAYGFESKSAVLQLTSDEGDAAGDTWQLVSDHSTGSLFVTNDITVEDTHATVLTIAQTGVVTSTNDIIAAQDTATTNAVVDVLQMTITSSGTAAANLGAGFTVDIEDEGAAAEEQAAMDFVVTTATDGAEDVAFRLYLNDAGTIAKVLDIQAASSGTTGDTFTFTQNTTETDAVLDIISLANVTGTAAAGAGLGITWDFEDAGGAEEQGSIDNTLTTATNASEVSDFVFSIQKAGAITEVVRMDGDGANLALNSTAPYLAIKSTNATNGDAYIQLVMDAEADAGDNWVILADGATEELQITNDAAALNTQVEVFGISATTGVRFQSTAPYLGIKSTNATNGDAILSLIADAGADAGDEWEIEHDGATNDLFFQNDTASADVPATVMTLAETGALTLTYYVTTKYYTNLTHPGSGAPVGSIISYGGDACGGDGNGTTVYVCVSDGTDWIAI